MSVERKEYQETQVFRSVSPVRNTRSSTQNVSQFDNNLGRYKKIFPFFLYMYVYAIHNQQYNVLQ